MFGLHPFGRLFLEGHAGFYPSDAGLGQIGWMICLDILVEHKPPLFQTHGLVDEVGIGEVIQEMMQEPFFFQD